jgi:uncharacterized protein
MKIFTVLLVLVVSGFYGVLNYYVGLRGYRIFENTLPYFNSRLYWIIFWFIVFSFVISRIMSRYLPHKINYYLSIIGYYWMSALIFFLISILFINILNLLIKILYPSFNELLIHSHIAPFIGLLLIFIVICVLIYGTINAKNPIIKTYSINIDKSAGNNKSLNVVFISDIHIGDIINKSRIVPMISSINRLKPDIVLLGGDTIDDDPKVFINEEIGNLFKNIKSRYGTYAVLGNHEYYSNKTQLIVDSLSGSGIKVLRDECCLIDNSFYIIGREDLQSKQFGIKRKSLSELMEGINKALPLILLDHQPPGRKTLLDDSVDIQLSGHTHGGQFFPNRIFTKMLYKNDWGYLKIGKFNLLVSDGYGTWGPPIRIGNKGEIMQIKISFGIK